MIYGALTQDQEIAAMGSIKTTAAVLALVGGLVSNAAPAMAQGGAWLIAGTLTCRGEGSVGLILGSSERLACVYVPAGRGEPIPYSATISKIGIDIGFKTESVMIWTVLGSSTSLSPDVLIGDYGGVSAEISVAIGGGANALIGGNRRSVVLQPVSVQGQTGLNIAVGVAGLTIRP